MVHLRGRTRKGGLAVGLGLLMMASGLLFAQNARGQTNGGSYLVVYVTDSEGGVFPAGSTVTQTVTIGNSSTESVGDSLPYLVVRIPDSLGVLGGGGGTGSWSCGVATGAAGTSTFTCGDGTLTPGQTDTFSVSYSVRGGVGNAATATYDARDSGTFTFSNSTTTVSGTNENINTASLSTVVPGNVADAASYTKTDAPPGGFPTKVGNDVVVTASLTQTWTFTDNTVTIRVVIPESALQGDSHVAVYRGAGSAFSGDLAGKNRGYVDGYAVAWASYGQTTGSAASSSITLQVNDPVVVATDTLYRANQTGVASSTGSVGSGIWVVSFTEDPGFVAATAATATTASSTSSSAGAGTVPTLPAAGLRVQRGLSLPVTVLGILLVVAGTVAIGLRKLHD